jgi:hypothetical protein
MNTYVTEMAESSIPTLASDSIFFDDCWGRYYSLITGRSYYSREDAEEDVIDVLTRNLNRITR